jgi:hypothetical protein
MEESTTSSGDGQYDSYPSESAVSDANLAVPVFELQT